MWSESNHQTCVLTSLSLHFKLETAVRHSAPAHGDVLLCLFSDALSACLGGAGPEEPYNPAAEYSRLCRPGRGAAGGASLCRVWPQERRISSWILSVFQFLSNPNLSEDSLPKQTQTIKSCLKTRDVYRDNAITTSLQTWKMNNF